MCVHTPCPRITPPPHPTLPYPPLPPRHEGHEVDGVGGALPGPHHTAEGAGAGSHQEEVRGGGGTSACCGLCLGVGGGGGGIVSKEGKVAQAQWLGCVSLQPSPCVSGVLVPADLCPC